MTTDAPLSSPKIARHLAAARHRLRANGLTVFRFPSARAVIHSKVCSLIGAILFNAVASSTLAVEQEGSFGVAYVESALLKNKSGEGVNSDKAFMTELRNCATDESVATRMIVVDRAYVLAGGTDVTKAVSDRLKPYGASQAVRSANFAGCASVDADELVWSWQAAHDCLDKLKKREAEVEALVASSNQQYVDESKRGAGADALASLQSRLQSRINSLAQTVQQEADAMDTGMRTTLQNVMAKYASESRLNYVFSQKVLTNCADITEPVKRKLSGLSLNELQPLEGPNPNRLAVIDVRTVNKRLEALAIPEGERQTRLREAAELLKRERNFNAVLDCATTLCGAEDITQAVLDRLK